MSCFLDATCPKCRKHIGWVGTMANKPACSGCGFREPQAELDQAEGKIQEYLAKARAKRRKQRDDEWKARTPAQERWYSEGQEAADSHGTRGKCITLPLDVPNPYESTSSQKLHLQEQSYWWLRGWRDAERGIDRRTGKHST